MCDTVIEYMINHTFSEYWQDKERKTLRFYHNFMRTIFRTDFEKLQRAKIKFEDI